MNYNCTFQSFFWNCILKGGVAWFICPIFQENRFLCKFAFQSYDLIKICFRCSKILRHKKVCNVGSKESREEVKRYQMIVHFEWNFVLEFPTLLEQGSNWSEKQIAINICNKVSFIATLIFYSRLNSRLIFVLFFDMKPNFVFVTVIYDFDM